MAWHGMQCAGTDYRVAGGPVQAGTTMRECPRSTTMGHGMIIRTMLLLLLLMSVGKRFIVGHDSEQTYLHLLQNGFDSSKLGTWVHGVFKLRGKKC